ncbi:DUF3291 domain-containing protein [uncultured Tenacibaculum sp.]|uniref:DUF3291 domain-containing protein n=1 Tax=uncultured Tenacibaculum sp. TaxID=174713 RepID=UPI0026188D59|nr:DUF3291 domain-containing protein [uncultured Tenacibaculum sp.]
MKTKHLAQYNIIRLKDELDSPIIKEFKDFLAPVNLLAEESGESATDLETPYEDKLIFINMSVWENYETLRNYSYKTVHSYFLKSRKKWSNEIEGHKAVLWYIDQGHIPTVAEAKEKLDLLNKNGSTPDAFSMVDIYTASGEKV